LNYGRIGAVGYGLNVVVLLSTAAAFTLSIPTTYDVSNLNLVGLVTPIPALLISIAWWGMGRDHKSSLFLATGVIGFLAFLAGLAEVIWTGISPIPTAVGQATPAFLMSLLPLLALSLITGLLAAIVFLLETVSFFSAGKALQNRLLRYAGWSRIFAIVAACAVFVIAFILGIFSILAGYGSGGPITMQYTPAPTPTPAQTAAFERVFSLALAGVYLILCVPELFAFFGFRRIPPPQPTTPMVQPVSAPASPVEPPPAPIGSPPAQ
jgi:hypothetical protein